MENKDNFPSEKDLIKETYEFAQEVKKWEKEWYPERAEFFEEERLELRMQQVMLSNNKGKHRKLLQSEKYAYKLLIITDEDEKADHHKDYYLKLKAISHKADSFIISCDRVHIDKAIGKIASAYSVKRPFNLIFVNHHSSESRAIQICDTIKNNIIRSDIALLLSTNSSEVIKGNLADSYIKKEFGFDELLEKLKSLTKYTSPGYPLYGKIDELNKKKNSLTIKPKTQDKKRITVQAKKQLFDPIPKAFIELHLDQQLEKIINESSQEKFDQNVIINEIKTALKDSKISNAEEKISSAAAEIESHIKKNKGALSYMRNTKGILSYIKQMKDALGLP
tara:strand:+ start:947 stop:1954 length:1008 start_codon:yes stop_codon:yes gene_type:complete